jgi:hypothetical protein
VFLTLMVIGLVGLVMMAIPALGRHGHAGGTGHGGHLGHGGHGGHGGHLGHLGHAGAHQLGSGHGAAHAGAGHVVSPHLATAPGASAPGAHGIAPAPGAGTSQEMVPADAAGSSGWVRFIPSPRAVFSVLALYGAFGNALLQTAHLPFLVAALVALLPTIAVERLAVTPLWNLVFRYQGQPSGTLEELIFDEATAVTPFRNGRGLISIVREGRLVQFSARLRADQASRPVKVGTRLRVEDVDARQERLTVSVLGDE